MLIFREGVHVCRNAHIRWLLCDAGSYFASYLEVRRSIIEASGSE
jgi:hypothetical protein